MLALGLTTFLYPAVGLLLAAPTLTFYEVAVGKPFEWPTRSRDEHPRQERINVATFWPVLIPILVAYAAVRGFIRRLL